MVDKEAKRAIRSIVDISMFIRTRQFGGQIFYLGSLINSGKDEEEETYIAAQLEGGELKVIICMHGKTESYIVSGEKLNNGYDHLIQVRNINVTFL